MLAVFVTGLAFGLSLIIAIGAQNAFVLRQGALRTYVGEVVAICTVSDLVLTAAGVAGAGALLTGHRAGFDVVRILGCLLLLGYAGLALRRFLQPAGGGIADAAGRGSRAGAVGACLAFTWLNPAVYLDTVVLLGSVAGTTHAPWVFALGAGVASTLWFVSLGYGARLLSPLLRSPRTWHYVDGFVAVIMVVTAVRVLTGA